MAKVQAKPFDYEFSVPSTALVVIDMQRDFIEPGGFGETLGNNVKLLAAIVPTVKRLLDTCRKAGITIIHTREAHRPDLSDLPPAKLKRGNPKLRIGDPSAMGRILIAGEPGNDIVAGCAFYATPLGDILRLRGTTHLLFAGVTTEVCVQTTMREANDRGYDSLLIEDATESYFPEFKRAAMDMIRAQGAIVGWTATCEQLAAALHK